MNKTLVSILVEDVVVPEILALLHRSLPTDATISIQLSKDVNVVKAVGQSFLDATRPAVPAPVTGSPK